MSWLTVAALLGLLASLCVGVALQGIVKGGEAEALAIIVLVLGLLLAAKAYDVNSTIARQSGPPTKTAAWQRWAVGGRHDMGLLVFVAAVAMVTVTGLDVHYTAEPVVSYQSAYDGVDPVAAGCSQGKGQGIPIAHVPVRADGADLGVLVLEYSNFCGTHWARYEMTSAELKRVKGTELTLSVTRPNDDDIAASSEVPELKHYAWGNMLGGGTCAYAQLSDGGHAGKHPLGAFSAQTHCLNLPRSTG